MPSYIAIDLGAESGRLVRGTICINRLEIKEIGRFPNGIIKTHGHLSWNLGRLFDEIRKSMTGLAKSTQPESIGVDTWGVDFVLLSADGSLAGPPVAYRDSRTDGMMERFFELIPKEKIYNKTGIQFMQINTLYQLFARAQQKSPHLASAETLLFIPDYFHYLLTGEKCSEFTIASTSQIYNIKDKTWDTEILKAIGVSPKLFQKIIQPGTIIGKLTKEIRDETGFEEIPVIAPASHDTASAVASVPAQGDDWAYISSGTWSLMGIETKEPILTEKAMKFNFTNEGGVNGTYRFLKNIMGLWTVQRIKSDLKNKYDYEQLTNMASESKPFVSLINLDDPRFLNPPSMIKAIIDFCHETGQSEPDTPGALVRCALESLALHYRTVLDELRDVQNKPINRIHIVGGGSQNELLCQMTADATGIPVLAGPTEATSIGNIIVQAQSLGHVDSLVDARSMVHNSFSIQEYNPSKSDPWNAALQRYNALKIR